MFSAIEAIYFVDVNNNIRDDIKLGHEFTQGLITEIEVQRSDRIRFAFPLDEVHILRIARASRLLGFGQRWLHLDA